MNNGFEHSAKEQKALKKLTHDFQNRKAEYIQTNQEHSKVTLKRGATTDKSCKKYGSIQMMKRCRGFDYNK